MGVDTLALMAHSLDVPGLKSLGSRLRHETGQEWTWVDEEPEWSDVGVIDLWKTTERYWLRGPEGAIWIAPRSAVLDLYQKLHYGCDDKEVLAKCHKLIHSVARAFGSSVSVIVPDSGMEISEASGWACDGWSVTEILAALSRTYSATASLKEIVTVTDDGPIIAAYGHLVWEESELVSQSTTFDVSTGAALPDVSVKKFDFTEMAFHKWEDRLLLTGSLIGDWPPNQDIALSELSQEARLLLIGVQEFRYARHRKGPHQGVVSDSEWIRSFRQRNPVANPSLKHYCLGSLEALAISHFLEVAPASDSPSGGIFRYITRLANRPWR